MQFQAQVYSGPLPYLPSQLLYFNSLHSNDLGSIVYSLPVPFYIQTDGKIVISELGAVGQVIVNFDGITFRAA